MPTPSYITNEDIHEDGILVPAALILTTPTRIALDYASLDEVDRARLDLLVQFNGGTLPLASEQVAHDFIIDNGTSWYDTYRSLCLEYVPGSGAGGGTGGTGGTGSGVTGNGVFVLDVVPASSGIVGSKTYKATAPGGTVISTAVSDTASVNVVIGASGSSTRYAPAVTLNGQPVTLLETPTKRWFTGTVPATLSAGDTTLTVTDSEGCTDTATITLAGAGPTVQSVVFGSYPGSQTAAKQGDVIDVTLTAAADAVSAFVVSGGASSGAVTLTRVGSTNVFTGSIVCSSASGSATITTFARNALGTAGANFVSPTLTLDQTTPSISSIAVDYPASQAALQTGQTATLTATVTSADSVVYSGADLSIPSPSLYESAKVVSHTAVGYQQLTYTITATYAATNAVTTRNATVVVATTAPTATIAIQGSPPRLVSSPVGVNYTVVITSTQPTASPPSLSASHGSWSGSWTAVGNTWSRTLVIADSTARGTGTFTTMSLPGPSGLVGSTIVSGSTYVVGGLTLRTLTFAAFSRVAAIGAAIADVTKTTAQYTGGSVLTRRTDNSNVALGYYPANSDGTYNATGSYLGLSDVAFAGSNTTGTLQVDFQETA